MHLVCNALFRWIFLSNIHFIQSTQFKIRYLKQKSFTLNALHAENLSRWYVSMIKTGQGVGCRPNKGLLLRVELYLQLNEIIPLPRPHTPHLHSNPIRTLYFWLTEGTNKPRDFLKQSLCLKSKGQWADPSEETTWFLDFFDRTFFCILFVLPPFSRVKRFNFHSITLRA